MGACPLPDRPAVFLRIIRGYHELLWDYHGSSWVAAAPRHPALFLGVPKGTILDLPGGIPAPQTLRFWGRCPQTPRGGSPPTEGSGGLSRGSGAGTNGAAAKVTFACHRETISPTIAPTVARIVALRATIGAIVGAIVSRLQTTWMCLK